MPPTSSGMFDSTRARLCVRTPAITAAAASISAPTWTRPAVVGGRGAGAEDNSVREVVARTTNGSATSAAPTPGMAPAASTITAAAKPRPGTVATAARPWSLTMCSAKASTASVIQPSNPAST